MLCKEYNIYCDESRVENKDSKKMTIGALFLLRSQKNKINNEVDKIFEKYNFDHELKWAKVGKKYYELYKELIDYFIDNKNLSFRVIIVDKSRVDFKKYHDGSLETAFYKFYYIMLKAKLNSLNNYYIFLDEKPTRDPKIVRALHKFLEYNILKNKKDCKIKHFQSYDSEDLISMQLSDFFTGLIGFACNDYNKRNSIKYQVAKYLKNKLKRQSLCKTSSLEEGKFNVFVWKQTK
jgi:hypothetical protein